MSEYIYRKSQLWPCECGAEYDQVDPLPMCDCGHTKCRQCTRVCEWCGHEGCGQCMVDGVDGWSCGEDCEQELARLAQEADKLADERVLDIVVERMIHAVIGAE
jgi:hypothetical protein